MVNISTEHFTGVVSLNLTQIHEKNEPHYPLIPREYPQSPLEPSLDDKIADQKRKDAVKIAELRRDIQQMIGGEQHEPAK